MWRGGGGVDLGIANIAVDSDGNFHSGSHVKSVRYRHRRLRAKLGPEFEAIIGTVRNVGYRFTLPSGGTGSKESQIPERVQ